MFKQEELQLISQIAKHLTGARSVGHSKRDTVVANIKRRMDRLGIASLEKYLRFAEADQGELASLISVLTIHTTSWFRENPHYVRFQQMLLGLTNKNTVFKVWCAACSTGEELYSFALVLEEFRRVHPEFDYCLVGTDIDPISLEVASAAIFEQKALTPLVVRYREHLLFGSGETEGLFTLSASIRKRCQFLQADLRTVGKLPQDPFDLVVCRNVLIYFDQETVQEVMSRVVRYLHPDGLLVVGHSENINSSQLGLEREGHSFYRRARASSQVSRLSPPSVGTVKAEKVARPADEPMKGAPESSSESPRIRLIAKKRTALVVDDLGVARQVIESLLKEIGFETHSVGTTEEATEAIKKVSYNLITLDLNLPGVGGFEWLTKIREQGLGTPIVLISEAERRSAGTVLRLLEAGAQEYIEKLSLRKDPRWVQDVILSIVAESEGEQKGRQLASRSNPSPDTRPEVILIGASTGGPIAIKQILHQIDKTDCPPIVIVQHISEAFLRPFAERISESAGLKLGSCENGEVLKNNHLYLATRFHHIGLLKSQGRLTLATSQSDPIHGHTPSVDHLFVSALNLSVPVLAVLLTGMGSDGAKGLLYLRQSGAFTMVQEESDCVVFGMPREALALGSANFVGNTSQIAAAINIALAVGTKTRAVAL